MGSCMQSRKLDDKHKDKFIIEKNFGKKKELFMEIEKYLPLDLISLSEYFTLIVYTFHDKNAILKEPNFIAFVNNKLLKNPLIGEYTINSDGIYNKYSLFSQYLFESYYLVHKSIHKQIHNEKYHNEGVPLYPYIIIGILYCYSSYTNKIEVIFNVLSNRTEFVSKKNNFTTMFFYSLFSIASTCLLTAIKMACEKDETLKLIITEDEYIEIYDGYQVKDSIHTANVVLDRLFEEKDNLNYDEFMKKVLNCKMLNNILYPSGIRYLIDNNNI
jgi:hypothetical protein